MRGISRCIAVCVTVSARYTCCYYGRNSRMNGHYIDYAVMTFRIIHPLLPRLTHYAHQHHPRQKADASFHVPSSLRPPATARGLRPSGLRPAFGGSPPLGRYRGPVPPRATSIRQHDTTTLAGFVPARRRGRETRPAAARRPGLRPPPIRRYGLSVGGVGRRVLSRLAGPPRPIGWPLRLLADRVSSFVASAPASRRRRPLFLMSPSGCRYAPLQFLLRPPLATLPPSHPPSGLTPPILNQGKRRGESLKRGGRWPHSPNPLRP